jgi:hypothetical protein
MKALVNVTGGLVFVALFFGVAYLADRDLQDARKLDAINAQAQAAENRLQRAARALCASELGPGAQALWTREGDLVCRPAVITAGAQP